MTTITINCPTTWYLRCEWIDKNCIGRVDATIWGMWQIGLDDIFYEVDDYDAVLYYLIWGS